MKILTSILVFTFILLSSNLFSEENNYTASDQYAHPSDFFPQTNGINWGMNYTDIEQVLNSIGVDDYETTSEGIEFSRDIGGAKGKTVILENEEKGAYSFVVSIDYEKPNKESSDFFLEEITNKYGNHIETKDNEDYFAYVWEIKNTYVLEFRVYKDSKTLRFQWVKIRY